jgi:signal transduction histidine kinase
MSPGQTTDRPEHQDDSDEVPAWIIRLAWIIKRLIIAGRGLAFLGLAAAGLAVAAALVVTPALIVALSVAAIHHRGKAGGLVLFLPVIALGLYFTLVPLFLLALRPLARLTRSLAGQWCRVPISDPYRPAPWTVAETGIQLEMHGPGPRRRLRWLLDDPATWRDLLWAFVNGVVGSVVVALPAGSVLFGFLGVFAPYASLPLRGLAILAAALGLYAAPRLMRGYGIFARSMLAPTRQAELALRVRHLSDTRTEALDTGAAEIRRIERDLHDGAQARLVAMGMTLDAAGQIIDTNPDAARALLYEARDASVKALVELRALVRGIHPPVLADRGLADAIQALTLDTPMRIHLHSDLYGRPSAPIESAAYFAVSELLANVSKHAEARQTWIDIRHTDGMLRIGVTDNGHGGADPARGSGLRGIERRLAAFDGVLAISSPPGGPTAVTMEIPCELSLPRTFSS